MPMAMSTEMWKRTLISVAFGELLALVGFSSSTPILPFYLIDLGIGDEKTLALMTGLIQTLPSITMAVMAPIWGRLADSYGRKPMLLRAMFGGAVMMALQGFATSPWQLLVLRTLQGAVTGTVAAATVMVATIAPRKQVGYSLGILQVAIFVGASLGPMLGGTVSRFFGHRPVFFVTAFFLAIGGLIVWKYSEDHFEKPEKKESFLGSLWPDFGIFIAAPALPGLFAIVAADQIASGLVSPFLPLFIERISSTKMDAVFETGLILGTSALASAAGALVIGRISYRLGYTRVLFVCLGGAAAFTLAQFFVSTPLQLLVLRIISSFLIGGNMPAVNALISEAVEESRSGSAYGMRTAIAAAAGALGPAIGSGIVLGGGYQMPFLAGAAILAASGVWARLGLHGSKKGGPGGAAGAASHK